MNPVETMTSRPGSELRVGITIRNFDAEDHDAESLETEKSTIDLIHFFNMKFLDTNCLIVGHSFYSLISVLLIAATL